MAQEEAHQRAQKRKFGQALPIFEGITKCYKIAFMDDSDANTDGDMPLPFIEDKVGNERINSLTQEWTGTQFHMSCMHAREGCHFHLHMHILKIIRGMSHLNWVWEH